MLKEKKTNENIEDVCRKCYLLENKNNN